MNFIDRSRVSQIIDDLFYSFEGTDDPLTDYVKCVDLSPIRRIAFAEHTDRRVEQASKLSICAHLTNNLSYCVRRLVGYRYRRLEEYAKYTGFAVIRDTTWFGHGKLIEVTLYYKYESRVPRWSRHLEIRLYFVVPVHFKDYVELFENFLDVFDNVARSLAESEEFWYASDMELDEERMDEMKYGVREVKVTDVSRTLMQDVIAMHAPCCLKTSWCNDVIRAVYGYSYAVIHDYRGYTIRIPHERAELFFESLYAELYEYFRWW